MLSFSTSRHAAETFGEVIRKAWLERGLTQKDVAEAVGVGEMTVVRWERYKTVPLRNRQKVERLCKALGMNHDAIFDRFARDGSLMRWEQQGETGECEFSLIRIIPTLLAQRTTLAVALANPAASRTGG